MLIRQLLHAVSNELIYILFFSVSILLVSWQYLGMNVQLDILRDVSSTLTPRVHSDFINGGKSTTHLSHGSGEIKLDCDILLSDTFAFCGVDIPLVEARMKGLDIRKYDQMKIELDYVSEHSDTILIYLMNEELLDDNAVLIKSNLRPVSPVTGSNKFELSTSGFFVPSWWVYQNSMHAKNIEPDISNVTSLQITTGDNTEAREVGIIIKKITFSGKWISADDLYFSLLLAWLMLFSLHVIMFMRALSQRFTETKMENKRLLELNRFLSIQKNQFETMAKKDKLTGAWNRAGVRDKLRSVLRDHKKYAIPCALLALDIDHFKDINDKFGHEVGDEALKNLVKLVNSHTRQPDTFARWGGEEFILICPNTDLHAAMNLAEMLRNKIENTWLIKATRITCSFGVAALQEDDIKAWFKQADKALYNAKGAGRNRVVTNQDEG